MPDSKEHLRMRKYLRAEINRRQALVVAAQWEKGRRKKGRSE
jgi:hypothetical protein